MKIKKLGALLVSAALCAGMAAPAFAFEGEAAPVEQPVLPEVVEEDVVTITDETNTRSEKSDYHKAAYALLAELIGNVHPHSSIHIVDCPPTSYGYGGITQEWRYQHA